MGIEESKYSVSDVDIVNKIIKQNDLEANSKSFKLKILRKTNVDNGRFSLIFETDSNTYNSIVN